MDVWSVLYAPHFASCAYGAICTSNLDDCVLARFVIVAVVRFLVPSANYAFLCENIVHLLWSLSWLSKTFLTGWVVWLMSWWLSLTDI
jgi:hypothetical protein